MRVGRREDLRERPARRVNGRARRTRRFLTSVRQRCLQRVDNRFKAADELSNALRASSGFAEHPASASIFSRGTCYASVTRVNKQQRVSQSPAVRSCGTDSRNADFRPRRRRCSPCRASNDLPESALGLSRRSPDVPHAAGLRRNSRASSRLPVAYLRALDGKMAANGTSNGSSKFEYLSQAVRPRLTSPVPQ